MQRNIQQITQHFIDRLPDNDQYYRPDELRSWEFPTFLVKRIKIELERNLAESLIIPKSDWANTQSDAVQNAWRKFVDAIRAEVRLPASYGKAVIETAVADILEMLVQPRKNIPEVIFGQDDQLSYDEIVGRLETVVVYQHFSKLLPRYMQKKELDKLSKDRCREIVSKADEKLTSGYSPLNWAQMLEPLFKLVDGEIDTNLLRLFFEDKNMQRVSRKFDLLNDNLTRAELIEILSSPDLLNLQGYEDDQSTLFEDQPTTKSPEPKPEEKSLDKSLTEEEEDQNKEQKFPDEDFFDRTPEEPDPSRDIEDQKDENKSPGKNVENSLNSRFGQEEQDFEPDETTEDEEHGQSLNAIFNNPYEGEIEKDEIAEELAKLSRGERVISQEESEDEQQEKNQSIAKEASDDTAPSDSKKGKNSSPNTASQENGQKKALEDEEDRPIWMRYMSDEEIEEHEKEQAQKESQQDEDIEEGFIDEPIIDLTKEDASDEEIETLRNQLSSDHELFVEEIFGGSERAFDEAIENIAAYDSWREASKYIEKDIFKRNLVDMYSEAAINFTDQLQSYFLDKSNQSK